MSTGFDDDELRDARLRRALEHAPDAGALPDPRTREAIRKMAHNLAAATPPAAAPTAQPWWRRLFGGGGPRGRMPWNAAFATLLVVGFVTVLWRQEPVPDARLDGEARVGGAAVEAPPAPPPAHAPAPVEPAASVAAPSPAPEAPTADAVRKQAESAVAPRRAPTPLPEKRRAPDEPAAKPREPAAETAPLAAESFRKSESERAAVRRDADDAAGALARPAPPPPLAYAPAPQADLAAPSAAPRARLAAAPNAASSATPFAVLERWTTWSTTDDPAGGHARDAIEAFPALLGAVARSATAPDAPLAAPVETRIALHRGRSLVAVLEIAGDQVRWSPQPGGAAFVGTPPAQALASLRAALERAREMPSTPRR